MVNSSESPLLRPYEVTCFNCLFPNLLWASVLKAPYLIVLGLISLEGGPGRVLWKLFANSHPTSLSAKFHACLIDTQKECNYFRRFTSSLKPKVTASQAQISTRPWVHIKSDYVLIQAPPSRSYWTQSESESGSRSVLPNS